MILKELILGLVAFPVRLSRNNNGIKELKEFIDEEISHFINKTSQRELMSYSAYDIYRYEPIEPLNENLLEVCGYNRDLIPSETFVIVGYYNSKDHIDWCRNMGLYNFRMRNRKGALTLTKELVGAKYLLLYTDGNTYSSELWKIIDNGPKVYSKDDFTNKGYSSDTNYSSYIVFEVEQNSDAEFRDVSWNFVNPESYEYGVNYAVPFAVNLVELMHVKCIIS